MSFPRVFLDGELVPWGWDDLEEYLRQYGQTSQKLSVNCPPGCGWLYAEKNGTPFPPRVYCYQADNSWWFDVYDGTATGTHDKHFRLDVAAAVRHFLFVKKLARASATPVLNQSPVRRIAKPAKTKL
jgi:hypothetical protein